MPEDFGRQLREIGVEAGRGGQMPPVASVRARGDQRRRRHTMGVTALSVLLFGGAAAGVAVSYERQGAAPRPAESSTSATPSPDTSASMPAPLPSPATPQTPSTSRTPSSSQTPPNQAARWASTQQFMEIQSGEARNGKVYLKVRPARKVELGESFRTEVIPGPFTEVALDPNARILYLSGESGSIEVFFENLGRRDRSRPNHVTPDQRQEGFDVYFDSQSRVRQVDWLYVL